MTALTRTQVAAAKLAGSKPNPIGALSGTFDGAVGGVTPAAGAFTTLDGILGSVTPAAATVTTLHATGLATLASAVLSGYFEGSVANGLTAVGTTLGTGLQLAKQYNVISTAATTAVGVVLPVGVIGMEIDINLLTGASAADINVYANGSETIDGVPGATGVKLTKAKTCRYKFVAANTWVSSLWGAVSA